MSNAYIYALCEPDTAVFRYVGKTVDLVQRFHAHCRDATATRKARWIQSLASEGKLPKMTVLEVVSLHQWEQAERFWIGFLRAEGFDLTNHTGGGEGLNNPSEETRAKIAAEQRRRFADPDYRRKLFTSERAKKISESLTGRAKTPEHIAKLPQNTKGNKLSPEACARRAQASKGRNHLPETIDKLRELNQGNTYGLGNRSRKGQKRSPEELAKASAAFKDVPKSQQHKENIRLAMLRYWAARKEKHHGTKEELPRDGTQSS